MVGAIGAKPASLDGREHGLSGGGIPEMLRPFSRGEMAGVECRKVVIRRENGFLVGT
ncbi:MAG: hypothetical protein AABZ47_18285 [Planctomycetota bacterium]